MIWRSGDLVIYRVLVGDGTRFHNPFAALAALRATMPDPVVEEAAPAMGVPAAAVVPKRAVVRLERAGRGGKEATVIEQLALGEAEREAWLKALKSALGCGGTTEGEHLVVQGDQRVRVRSWLLARGVKKVIG